MHRNMSDWERVASIAGGVALAVLAARRSDNRGVATAAASGLLARGLTGFCPVNAAIGRDSRHADSREQLSGPRGVHVRESVTIARPVGEVFEFWRNFANLPRFMAHLEDVAVLGPNRSRWTARGPAGTSVTWEAEIINELPGELIGWRSLEDSDIATAGSVHFEPAPHGGTRLLVHLQYNPPAGKLGSWVASLFGEEPGQQIREDLRRLRAFLEAGEAPTVEGQPSGRAAFPGYRSREGNLRPFPTPASADAVAAGLGAPSLRAYEEGV